MIPLRSKLRRGVLTFFYRKPKARVYVRQLAVILGVDSTNLSRELARLERDGFLRFEVEGRQRYYSVNPHYRQLGAVMDLLSQIVGEEPPGRG